MIFASRLIARYIYTYIKKVWEPEHQTYDEQRNYNIILIIFVQYVAPHSALAAGGRKKEKKKEGGGGEKKI